MSLPKTQLQSVRHEVAKKDLSGNHAPMRILCCWTVSLHSCPKASRSRLARLQVGRQTSFDDVHGGDIELTFPTLCDGVQNVGSVVKCRGLRPAVKGSHRITSKLKETTV